jgi:hypothetical protein
MKEHWTQKCRHFIIMSGKSGSTALNESIREHLQRNGMPQQTVGCHGFGDFEKRMFGGKHIEGFDLNNVMSAAQKFWALQNKNIFIYDAFRLPIERSFSAFIWHNKNLLWNATVPEIINIFNDRQSFYSESYLSHEDMDLKQFGFDVESFKYDKSKKCIHETQGNVHFIGLRFDEIKQWPEIINNISSIGNFHLKHKYNQSEHPKYKQCVQELQIPKKFLDELIYSLTIPKEKIKNSEIRMKVTGLKRFLTDEEIEEYIELWKPRTF